MSDQTSGLWTAQLSRRQKKQNASRPPTPEPVPAITSDSLVTISNVEESPAPPSKRVLTTIRDEQHPAATVCFEPSFASFPRYHRLRCGYTVETETPQPCGVNCAKSETLEGVRAQSSRFPCSKACEVFTRHNSQLFTPKKYKHLQLHHARRTQQSHVYGYSEVEDVKRHAEKDQILIDDLKDVTIEERGRKYKPRKRTPRKRSASPRQERRLEGIQRSLLLLEEAAAVDEKIDQSIETEKLNDELEIEIAPAQRVAGPRGSIIRRPDPSKVELDVPETPSTFTMNEATRKELKKLEIDGTEKLRRTLPSERSERKARTEKPRLSSFDSEFRAEDEKQYPCLYGRRTAPGHESIRSQLAGFFSMTEKAFQQMVEDEGEVAWDQEDGTRDKLPRNDVDTEDNEIDDDNVVTETPGENFAIPTAESKGHCVYNGPWDYSLESCTKCKGWFHPACIGKAEDNGDVPASQKFSTGHECDHSEQMIFDARFACVDCQDYDVCEACLNVARLSHDQHHRFKKISAVIFTCPDYDRKSKKKPAQTQGKKKASILSQLRREGRAQKKQNARLVDDNKAALRVQKRTAIREAKSPREIEQIKKYHFDVHGIEDYDPPGRNAKSRAAVQSDQNTMDAIENPWAPSPVAVESNQSNSSAREREVMHELFGESDDEHIVPSMPSTKTALASTRHSSRGLD